MKFEIELAMTAVVVVDAVDENTARIQVFKTLESRLKAARKVLGVDELELVDVIASEPLPVVQ